MGRIKISQRHKYTPSPIVAAKEALLQGLELSAENRDRVSLYYDIVISPALSEEGAYFIDKVWDIAATDEQLEEALSFIDNIQPPYMEGQKLWSEDEEMRRYLSEHLDFLVEQKQKKNIGELKPLEVDNPAVMMLCPDGAGMVRVNTQGQLFDSGSQEICSHCNHKISEHRILTRSDDGSPQPTPRPQPAVPRPQRH